MRQSCRLPKERSKKMKLILLLAVLALAPLLEHQHRFRVFG